MNIAYHSFHWPFFQQQQVAVSSEKAQIEPL